MSEKKVVITVDETGNIKVDNRDFHDYELCGLLMECHNSIAQRKAMENNIPTTKKLVREIIDEYEQEEREEEVGE